MSGKHHWQTKIHRQQLGLHAVVTFHTFNQGFSQTISQISRSEKYIARRAKVSGLTFFSFVISVV